MSKKTAPEQSDAPTIEPAAPPLDGVEFKSPILQLAKALLGPFLRHGPECTAASCACGVTEAALKLRDKEIQIQRYGSVDA